MSLTLCWVSDMDGMKVIVRWILGEFNNPMGGIDLGLPEWTSALSFHILAVGLPRPSAAGISLPTVSKSPTLHFDMTLH